MAGKICQGIDDVPSNPILSRCFCEGRKGAEDAYPGAGQNPHAAGTPENLAWKRGFDSYIGPTAERGLRDCCAGTRPAAIVPDVVGMSEAEAIRALEAAGYVALLGTGTVDPVISQLPVAGDNAALGTVVTYNLTV